MYGKLSHRLVFVAVLLAQGCTHTDAAPAAADPPQRGLAAVELELMELVNRERAARRLAPLTPDVRLAELAREHSQAMAGGLRPFGHDGFAGRSRLARAVVPGAGPVNENVAANHREPTEAARHAVHQWLHSPGHRDALLDAASSRSGVGVSRAPTGEFFFTQLLVAPRAARAGP